MSRLTKRLTGVNGGESFTIGAQIFRTMFLSWFHNKKPTMSERELIADRMMHSVETQLGTYTKQAGSGQKIFDPAEDYDMLISVLFVVLVPGALVFCLPQMASGNSRRQSGNNGHPDPATTNR
jgi:hypothetical protein